MGGEGPGVGEEGERDGGGPRGRAEGDGRGGAGGRGGGGPKAWPTEIEGARGGRGGTRGPRRGGAGTLESSSMRFCCSTI